MKKVDVLMEILNKIEEQDVAVATEPMKPKMEEPEAIIPISLDNKFFGQLKAGDIFSDLDDETIKYRVVSDPVADPETGMVTSLLCEVIEAPEGNLKGVEVGDKFDAITSMPKKIEAPAEPPAVEEPVDEEPPAEAKKKDNKPAWKRSFGKQQVAPTQPGKKGKKGEGYTLKKRFGGSIREILTSGVVQEITDKGIVVRMGKWHKVFPHTAGVKVGDYVEIEGEKISRVISSQDHPIFSKEKKSD